MANRVMAVLKTYNEEQIIYWTLKRLIRNNIDVYIIDNCSTDKTLQIAGMFPVKCIEKIETNGYEWGKILTKTAEIMAQHVNEYDWFINHDSDEFFEGIDRNIVNILERASRVNVFGCTVFEHYLSIEKIPEIEINGMVIKDNPEIYHTHYFRHSWSPDNFQRIINKSVVKSGLEMMIKTGGHQVINKDSEFLDVNRIKLHHYPVVDLEHAERKILKERNCRYIQSELKRGWHKQYENITDREQIIKKFLRKTQ